MTVDVHPLAPWMRKTKYRPGPSPVFPDGLPSREEIELALALLDELDPDSQAWYGAQLADRLRAKLRDG